MRGKKILTAALSAVLVASFCMPISAYATVEGDQTPATQAEIDAALASGELQDESYFANIPATFAANDKKVTTIGGVDRYDTSAKEALAGFPQSQTAIIASGAGYADSIAAAGLAGALNCPIILTEPDHLTGSTLNALKQMGAKSVILLGSTDVMANRVQTDLEANGIAVADRLWGVDRYNTQMAIYNYGVENNLWTGDTAVVASAIDFADALSISPVSYALKAPVFFTDYSLTFPQAQYDAIRKCSKTKFLLTGSTAVTSQDAFNKLDALGDVARLGGVDRYNTSLAINRYAVKYLGFTWDGAAITSGGAPYDALGGGALQGKDHHLLALADEPADARLGVTAPLDGNHPATLKFLGDKAIFSMAYKVKVAKNAGFMVTDIDGFRVYLDAGHGQDSNGPGAGLDPGASGCGQQEYLLTQDLARRVSNSLKASYGIDSYVNTKGWYKTRQAEASNMDCGLLVSIHFNAGGGAGTESYIHSYNAASGSQSLQASITPRLASAVGRGYRGMFAEAFAVCGGKVPATLLEVCFIDNWGDMNQYNSHRDNVAAAIAQGIALL